MLGTTLRRRLFGGLSLLAVLSAALGLLLVLPALERDAREEVRSRLLDQARLVRAALRDRAVTDADLAQEVGELARANGIRITVVDRGGRVLADSDIDPARLDNHATRPEILAAKVRGEGSSVRFSDSLRREMMYVALPLVEDAQPSRYVRTAMAVDQINERTRHLRRRLWLAAAAVLVIGLALAALVARSAARPIEEVAAAADAIAAGDYARRIEVVRQDEVGRLASAFNATCARLAEQLEGATSDRNKLTAMLGSMAEGVIAVDRKERILHLNAVAAGLFGVVGAERLVGRPLYEATRVPEISEALTEAIEGTGVQRTLRLEERSPPRVLELNAAPLRNGSGRIFGAVLVLHDVTQLHRLEGVRRQFVSNVSHELKTPLTAIRGFVETLIDAEDDIDVETRRRFLEKIRQQTSRLSALVADLLSLSRIESGASGVERHKLDLRVPVMESVRSLRPVAEERGVELTVELPQSPVVMVGEEEALRQACSNLIDNAVKYSDDGGQVWVRLRREADAAVLEVEDRGLGIEPEHLERIFERFYRIDKARSRDQGGTGLGLAIVKNVAQAFGGEVSVNSEPGSGSVFSMRFPAGADERVA